MFGPLIRFLGATDDDDDGVRRKQQQIQALGAYLGRVQLATASRRRVVESVRQVAEVVVWSDRRSPALLDAVLAAALPQSLLRLLTDARITPDHPIATAVTVQVLQTLGIVLDGATSTRFIDALLGTNDFVNRLITAPVDLRSDEVLAYYAALLKALALRLTPANIHLFIRQEPQAFPLFAAAAALFDHEDSMVRVAVRAVTLSVIRINDVHAMDIILTAPACAAVWGNVMHALKDACDDAFRVLVDAPQEPRPEGLQRATWAAVDQALEDHMGLLAYINDVCALGVARVNHAIAKEFADRILARTYVHAIDVGGRAGSSPEETLFMQVTTLCIAQFFAIVRYSPLLADTIAALFVPAATDAADAAHKTLFVPLSWRDSSSRTLAPWLCLVLEILANKAISPTVLVKSVLTPHRMLRTRAQLESLTGSGNDSTVSNAADDMDVGRGGSARSVVAAMVHILTELPSSHASSWHTIRLAAHVLEQLTRSSPRGPIVVEPQGLADELLAAQRQHSAELHAMLMSVDDDSLEKSDNDSSNSAWTGQHNGNAAGGYADSVAWKVLAACLFDFANNSPETLRNRLDVPNRGLGFS
ncbi:Protein CL16A [Coemansia sp. RSA 2322]|nr:Protein CL16A [Coemansia sp. RSA 2322]